MEVGGSSPPSPIPRKASISLIVILEVVAKNAERRESTQKRISKLTVLAATSLTNMSGAGVASTPSMLSQTLVIRAIALLISSCRCSGLQTGLLSICCSSSVSRTCSRSMSATSGLKVKQLSQRVLVTKFGSGINSTPGKSAKAC